MVGVFITLLQTVAFTSDDREVLKKLWERLKWQLRIFSRGNELFDGALKRLDKKRSWIESLLEKGFIPVNLAKLSRVPSVPAPLHQPNSSIHGFPNFPSQSMEELLHTEGLASRDLNTRGFPEGFMGFEDVSGWEGFDLNNM